jgi:hypothetical protein
VSQAIFEQSLGSFFSSAVTNLRLLGTTRALSTILSTERNFRHYLSGSETTRFRRLTYD